MPTLITLLIPLAGILIAAPGSQFAADEFKASQENPRMYALDEDSVHITKVGPAATAPRLRMPPIGNEEPSLFPTLDELINIGQKAWKIIADNKPVVDVKKQYATALPRGSTAWTAFAGWRPPAGEIYELTAKNGYGFTIVDVRYQVLRTYGGSYEGKGKYLTAVTVEPLYIDVGWGYRFSMEACVPDKSIVNMGTTMDPVAGLMATLSWRISTPLKDSSGQSEYFLQGDGSYREVGGPFSNEALGAARTKAASLLKTDFE